MYRQQRFILTALFILTGMAACKKEPDTSSTQNSATQKQPLAQGGADSWLVLPQNSALLDGQGSYDPGGSKLQYQWTKVAGPVATIVDPTSARTVANNLVQGHYRFELLVTNEAGLRGRDTVDVHVSAPFHAPVARAGADQHIVLPSNSAVLNGSQSTDADGDIQSFSWAQLSGPAPAFINNPADVQTSVGNLVYGNYTFQLKVTDSGGRNAVDTMQISVDSAKTYTYYQLFWNDPANCIIHVPQLSAHIPAGSTITVYLRYNDYTGSAGPWGIVGTTPPGWYYTVVNDSLLLYCTYILCEWDAGYYDVRVAWN